MWKSSAHSPSFGFFSLLENPDVWRWVCRDRALWVLQDPRTPMTRIVQELLLLLLLMLDEGTNDWSKSPDKRSKGSPSTVSISMSSPRGICEDMSRLFVYLEKNWGNMSCFGGLLRSQTTRNIYITSFRPESDMHMLSSLSIVKSVRELLNRTLLVKFLRLLGYVCKLGLSYRPMIRTAATDDLSTTCTQEAPASNT